MTGKVDIALLHGGGQGSWVWEALIAAIRMQDGALAEGEIGTILPLDVPGCGTKRGRDTAAIGFDDIVAELIADIEAAGLSRVMLVGHSQAGGAMSAMVARRPDLFARLVHVTTSIPLPGQTVIDLMGEGRHGESDTQVGWAYDRTTETSLAVRYPKIFCNDMDAAETAALMRKLGEDMWPMSSYAYTAWDYAPHAAVPATYVLCIRDAALPEDWQRRFAERFAAERIVQIDSGHQPMNSRPHALAEILRAEARL